MTAVVTGATGFLGSALVKRQQPVRILTRDEKKARQQFGDTVTISPGDITDTVQVQRAVAGATTIYHLAGRLYHPSLPPELYRQTHVEGTRILLGACRGQTRLRRIVHVSSITVHGVDVHGTADETAALCGGFDPYSRSKVAGEQLLQQMICDRGAPVTIVRPGLIYGPRDTNSFGRFARLVEQGKMVIIGSGNNHLPLIYVTDVARGMLLASEADQASGRAYLLVNDELVTQRDYLNAIAKELGVPPPSRHIPNRLALALGATAETVGHLTHMKQPPPIMRFGLKQMAGENRFTIRRIRSELGFIPQVSLVEGVRKGIAWYRASRRAENL